MANDDVLGPRKTMFVLVIVVGCFAVLWPRILSPLILGSAREQLKPNKFDREAGCCEVIFETEVAVLELVNEVCSSAVGATGKLSPYAQAECRRAVNETCGLDIAAFMKRNENVGKTTKVLLETMKSSNSSCLKEHFGVPVWSFSSHPAQNTWSLPDKLKQERSPIRGMGPHPALRERGRAIPVGAPSPAPRPVPLPPHARVRASPLSVYYELDIKPPPIPGMRPPLGSPGGPVAAPKSSMGFVMPIYTICIIVFFVYTLSKILFKRTGSSPYEPVAPDPHFRRRVFRDESRSSPETKLVVTAISGLVAEVHQQMEAGYAQNQQRQDVQDNHTRSFSNGTVLSNGTPIRIIASEYREQSKDKSFETVVEEEPSPETKETTPEPKEETPEPKELTTESKEPTSELIESTLKEESFARKEASPEPEDVSPKTKDVSPQSKSVSPEPKDVSPEPSDVSPQSKSVSPEPKDVSPEPKDESPEPVALISEPIRQIVESKDKSEEPIKDTKENVFDEKIRVQESLTTELSAKKEQTLGIGEEDTEILESTVEFAQDQSPETNKDQPEARDSSEPETLNAIASKVVKSEIEKETDKLVKLTQDLLDDARIEATQELQTKSEKQSTPELLEEALKEDLDGESEEEEDDDVEQENASVKVVGMEVTAHTADGGAWPRAEPPPVAPASAAQPRAQHEAEDVKSIYLQTEIPQQSRVLVADFKDTPSPRHSPLVVSGKMTLSLIQDAPRETPEREPESTVDEFTTASAFTQNAAEKEDDLSDEEVEEEIEIEEIEEEMEEEEEPEEENKK